MSRSLTRGPDVTPEVYTSHYRTPMILADILYHPYNDIVRQLRKDEIKKIHVNS